MKKLLRSSRNQFMLVYLLLISSIVYVVLLYELSKMFFLIPITLTIVIYKLGWDKTSRVFALLFLFALFLMIIVFLINEYEQQKRTRIESKMLDYLHRSKPLSSIEQQLNNQTRLEFNIFFVHVHLDESEFSTKKMCAIESTAKNNPNAGVFALSVNSNTNQLQKILTGRFKNLAFLNLINVNVFTDTPLEHWWETGVVFKSPYSDEHITEAARLALLYQYGGLFSDSGTINFKSYEPLWSNQMASLVFMNSELVSKNFFMFRKRHPLIESLMETFKDGYNIQIRTILEPEKINAKVKKYCKVSRLDELTPRQYNSASKCNLVIYPREFFYPYGYLNDEYTLIFRRNYPMDWSLLNQSYSLGYYEHLSDYLKASATDNSVFTNFAMDNCELTFDHVKSNNLLFK